MNSLKLNAIIFGLIFITNTMHCQEKNNVEVIKNISKVLQLPGTTSTDITCLSGKKSTECEFKSNRFQHIWTIQNGKLIDFSEHK